MTYTKVLPPFRHGVRSERVFTTPCAECKQLQCDTSDHWLRYAPTLENVVQCNPAYFYQAVGEDVRFEMICKHRTLGDEKYDQQDPDIGLVDLQNICDVDARGASETQIGLNGVDAVRIRFDKVHKNVGGWEDYDASKEALT